MNFWVVLIRRGMSPVFDYTSIQARGAVGPWGPAGPAGPAGRGCRGQEALPKERRSRREIPAPSWQVTGWGGVGVVDRGQGHSETRPHDPGPWSR